jgi:hypothetical protein
MEEAVVPNWIPLLVRAEDYMEFAALVTQREAGRSDALDDVRTESLPTVSTVGEPSLADAELNAYPSWSEDLLRRLARGSEKTAQRWAMALDVVTASDDQTWFTTSEIAERSGMGLNAWRDAPRKLPVHLTAQYPDAPRTAEGHRAWPLLGKGLTGVEVSWAATPAVKASWRKIRGL